jgi:hemerythrin-like domain-containing protein
MKNILIWSGGYLVEDTLIQILSELKNMRSDINDIKKGQQNLEAGLERVEAGLNSLQENLVDSLGMYTEKIVEHVDNKTEVLNKRVFKVESEIERLSRQ